MKKTIIIKQLERVNAQNLPVIYPFKNKMRALIGETEWKDFNIGEKIPHRPDFNFNKNNREIKISFEIMEDESQRTKYEQDIISLVNNFWGNHPLMLVNGKRHDNMPLDAVPMFDMIDEEIVLKNTSRQFYEKLEAMNMIVNMEKDVRRDVAYFHGVSPVGLKEEELVMKLADFNTGICVTNAEEFLKVWKNDNGDRDILVVIHKALEKKVIETKKDNNRVDYYLGTEHLGTSVNDILAYCKRNEKIYKNHILRAIDEKVSFADEDRADKVMKDTDAETVNQQEKDFDALKAEAVALSEEGYMRKPHPETKIEKLRTAVKEARKKKRSWVAV